MTHASALPVRGIRSFVRRQGRLTSAQRRALDDYAPTYCLPIDRVFDPVGVFGRQAPLFLEIGFGNGECLAAMAANRPDCDFIGIEVHPPGIGHLLLALQRSALPNVRVYAHDAMDVLPRVLPERTLDAVHVFFPDPWPKKRHHKRRLVNADFLALVARKLQPGGALHIATDWQEYAESMLALLNASELFVNTSPDGAYCPRPDYRPETKFERRGMQLGHGVWDLIFRRSKAAPGPA